MGCLGRKQASEAEFSITVPLLLFIAAAIIRVFFLLEVFDYHAYFPKYVELSRRFMGELSPPIEVFYSSPFYILLLAFLKSVVSLNVEQIKLLQAFVGSFNVVLIYFTAKEFFNSKIALLAAGLSVIYAPLILHDCSLLTATYVISFNLLGLITFSKFLKNGKIVFLALAGIFFGLSLITRPNVSLFIIIIAASLLFPRKIGLKRHSLLCFFLFVISFLLPVAPVAGLNYLRSGEWVWINNSGGWVFYCSNNRNSTGVGFHPPPELMKIGARNYLTRRIGIGYTEHLDSITIARERTGKHLFHKEVSHYWFARGLEEIKENPRRFFNFLARKSFYALNQFEAHDTLETTLDGWRMVSIPLLNFGMVIPFALVGIFFPNGVRKDTRWPLLFYLLSYFISLIIFYTIPRLRLPAEPILLLFASHAIFLFFDVIHLRKIKTLLILGTLLATFSLVTYVSDRNIQVHREIAMPNAVRLAQGTRLLKAGKVSQAIPLLKKIIELNPQDKTAQYCLEITYQKLGIENLP
jgi:4-amino-4-deoxy-L-arabinose transferase-like glycosyltransferase